MCEKEVIKVAVAVIRDDGRVIVARRDEQGQLANQWELPGGSVCNGSPEEGLKEHLAKKFNLDVVVGDRVCTAAHEYEFGKVEVTAYYVECISKKLRLAEHLSYRWVRPSMFKEFEMVQTTWPIIEQLKQQNNLFV